MVRRPRSEEQGVSRRDDLLEPQLGLEDLEHGAGLGSGQFWPVWEGGGGEDAEVKIQRLDEKVKMQRS